MDCQQVGSVRKTIALKLRDQPNSKVEFPAPLRREDGELCKGGDLGKESLFGILIGPTLESWWVEEGVQQLQ